MSQEILLPAPAKSGSDGKAPHQDNRKLHVIYLGKNAPGRSRTTRSAKAFGFYDEISEVFGEDLGYRDVFGMNSPSALQESHFSARQLFVLEEMSEGEGKPLLNPDEEEKGNRPFLGAIFLSFDMLEEKNQDDLKTICKDLRDQINHKVFKKEAREDDRNARTGSLSAQAEVRFFLCPNCADLCVTVRTGRLQDIFLMTKAVSLLAKADNQDQFSRVWSLVASDIKPAGIEKHIQHLSQLNSHVVVDFRISFKTVEDEKDFLKVAIPYKNTPPGVERVGGVLGTGSYSVHLTFEEYLYLWVVLDAKTQEKRNVNVPLPESFPDHVKIFLQFLLNAAAQTCIISNERLRFCYQQDLFQNELSTIETGVQGNLELAGFPKISNPSVPTALENIETLLSRKIRYLQELQVSLPNNEAVYHERLSLLKDLLYTFSDVLYRNDIHTYIFISQLLAFMGGMERYVTKIRELFPGQAADEFLKEKNLEDAKRYTKELINSLKEGSLSLYHYNHSVVTVSRDSINAQNYSMPSKVNIEKYLVAYSFFLQKICKVYAENGKEQRRLYIYPYVYIDIAQNGTNVMFLFRRFFDMLGTTKIPALLPVACPNYDRFANVYSLLPMLVHEVSHQFLYMERNERNTFVLKQGMRNVAERLLNFLYICLPGNPMADPLLHSSLAQRIQLILSSRFELDNEPEQDTDWQKKIRSEHFFELRESLIRPYFEDIFSDRIEGRRDIRFVFSKQAASAFEHFLITINVFAEQLYVVQRRFGHSNSSAQLLVASTVEFLLKNSSATKENNSKCHDECAGWEELIRQYSGSECAGNDPLVQELLQGILKCLQQLERQTGESCVYETTVFYDAAHLLWNQGFLVILSRYSTLKTMWHYDKYAAELLKGNTFNEDNNNPGKFWQCLFEIYLNPDDISSQDLLRNLLMIGRRLAEQPGNGSPFERSLRQCQYVKKLVDTLVGDVQEQLQAYHAFVQLLGNRCRFTCLVGESERATLHNMGYQITEFVTSMSTDPLFQTEGNQLLLNQLSMPEVLIPALEKACGMMSVDEWADEWNGYLQIYYEVCADIGMCIAFHFTPIGYLTFTANYYVEYVAEDQLLETQYDFRNRRYEMVVRALQIKSDKSTGPLLKEVYQILSCCIGYMEKTWTRLPSSASKDPFDTAYDRLVKSLDGEDYQLKKLEELTERNTLVDQQDFLNQAEEIAKEMYGHLSEISILFYTLSEEKRANTSINSIDLEHSLRYMRVIRHLVRTMEHSNLLKPDRIFQDCEEEHFGKLYRCAAEEPWIRQLQEDKQMWVSQYKHPWMDKEPVNIYEAIGAYYNSWGTCFAPQYDFPEQNSFVMDLYGKAHAFYKPLMNIIAKVPSPESESLKIEESNSFLSCWFDTLYPTSDGNSLRTQAER